MCAAAAVAPAAVAPTLSTATPIPRSAARASARVSRAPSPSDSRKSATEPTSSSSHSASSIAAASTTAWLPTEATVWKRSPRPSAIALTATFPLCETSAMRPAGRGASASPHSAARLWNATSPSQFGPITGRPAAVAASRSSACSAADPASANPAAKTTSPPQPRRPAARTTSGTPGGRDRDHDRVRRLGQVVERRHARPSEHRRARRVHAPDRAGEPERLEVAQRRVAVGARPVRRADDGHRARPQQRRERAQRSTFATPRRSSERAMMSRWISLVPSQMRSTRSSRSSRSATLSRR